MGYRDDMRFCIEYIDSHLNEELQPKALAKQFGYSFYHFCHVFRSVNGIAVGKYIQRQRLNMAYFRANERQKCHSGCHELGI